MKEKIGTLVTNLVYQGVEVTNLGFSKTYVDPFSLFFSRYTNLTLDLALNLNSSSKYFARGESTKKIKSRNKLHRQTFKNHDKEFFKSRTSKETNWLTCLRV